MTSAVYDIPVPPSLNNIYPTGKSGRRFLAPAAKLWATQAGWELKQQKARLIPGKVSVALTVRAPQRRTDIDGKIKAVLDLLVKQGVIEADHDGIVRRVSAEWGDVPRARVEIRSVK